MSVNHIIGYCDFDLIQTLSLYPIGTASIALPEVPRGVDGDPVLRPRSEPVQGAVDHARLRVHLHEPDHTWNCCDCKRAKVQMAFYRPRVPTQLAKKPLENRLKNHLRFPILGKHQK